MYPRQYPNSFRGIEMSVSVRRYSWSVGRSVLRSNAPQAYGAVSTSLENAVLHPLLVEGTLSAKYAAVAK